MNSPVSGFLAMIQPAWHHVSGSIDHRAGELYQISLMSAVMAGVYEGEATYGEIRKYGDFDVGTFNDLAGEMVGFDGTFYCDSQLERRIHFADQKKSGRGGKHLSQRDPFSPSGICEFFRDD